MRSRKLNTLALLSSIGLMNRGREEEKEMEDKKRRGDYVEEEDCRGTE